MAYALTNTEPVGLGIVRILQEEITGALQQLTSEGGDNTIRIHECRKHLKKTRAVVRLVRSGLPRELRRDIMNNLRNGAQAIGPVRELDAYQECLAAVRAGAKEPSMKRALRFAQQHIAQYGMVQQESVPDAMKAASSNIAEAKSRIESYDFEAVTLDTITTGIMTSYRNSRSLYKSAIRKPDAPILHEWRKRAKDLRYQLAVVANAWPAMLLPLETELHTLTDHLGLIHDLALLIEMLEKGMWPSIKDRTRAKVLLCAAQRYQQEQAAAFRLGARLFAEKPHNFRKRFTHYLEIWEAEKQLIS